MTQTPDEWLLDEFDRRHDKPYRDASITNHVRPMFELLADAPLHAGHVVMTGSAKWPNPHLHDDLDEIERAARDRAAWQAQRTQGLAS